ncbi:MAG: hypothetical protein WC114_12170 [Smithellaceae bacterium]|jgi:hypothetical protein
MTDENKEATPSTQPSQPAQSTQSASPSTSKQSGKQGINKSVIIVLAIILVLVIVGWLAQGYLAKKTAENLVGDLIDSNVELDTEGNVAKVTSDDGSFEMSGTAKWPDDMPAEVPEFTAGIVESSAKSTVDGSGSGWTVSFKSVKAGAYSSYRDQLLAKSWSETGTYESDSKMTNMENDKYYLIFTVDETNSTGSLVVSAKQ